MEVDEKKADEIFNDGLKWLRNSYTYYQFFVERDVVWTLQMRLKKLITDGSLPYTIFNDYGILPGNRRSLSTDLAILYPPDRVLVAAEFKYEPSHERKDIRKEKFPIVLWGAEGVAKDVGRVRQYVDSGKALIAYSVFIDEGGYFHRLHHQPHANCKWLQWDNGVWLHWCRYPSNG